MNPENFFHTLDPIKVKLLLSLFLPIFGFLVLAGIACCAESLWARLFGHRTHAPAPAPSLSVSNAKAIRANQTSGAVAKIPYLS
jgi:hypothetical protein